MTLDDTGDDADLPTTRRDELMGLAAAVFLLVLIWPMFIMEIKVWLWPVGVALTGAWVLGALMAVAWVL